MVDRFEVEARVYITFIVFGIFIIDYNSDTFFY